ncbi:tetratricopeptide repeat protein [Aeromonas enteropelogenes]|uniref:tetratricopeptide repeat protein n=1 Tax=Aeromonas enteropelogenes TaxID=29489 RepID=UPI003BA0BAD1
MRIGRNDKCTCGSNKKYKKCCLHKKAVFPASNKNITQLIDDAGSMAIQHDKKSIVKAISILSDILLDDNLSKDNWINAKLNLSVAYRNLGEHKNAIKTLKDIEQTVDRESDIFQHIQFSLAISYGELGYSEKSCRIHDSIIEGWSNVKCTSAKDRRLRGAYLIEAGKSFRANGETEKAIKHWSHSIEILKEFGESEAEHIGRAKANIAFSKLKSDNESIQAEGVAEVEESSKNKLLIGDAQGLANNYCNLGSYFWTKKRYSRAIAYYRKDLFLTEAVGNKRELASTLGNLALLYTELRQFKQARKMHRQAELIGNELTDDLLQAICRKRLEHINSKARLCSINKINMGDKAECGCGSEKLYIDCCGLADFEPVSMPQIYGGLSEDAKNIHTEINNSGKVTSPLDFILRNTSDREIRKSWIRQEIHDGWISMKELPDMASLHIISAMEMAKKASGNGEESYSLSAVILAVCHLEAFINQVSFFVFDNMNHPEIKDLDIPNVLKEKGAYDYQRTTNLEDKWMALSKCLNGSGWLESIDEWKSAKDLIYIRNELVHFKTNGYEQVVPPPRTKAVIYSKIPTSVVTRDAPHSWPFKLLTGSLASWSVEVSKGLVNKMKADYNSARRRVAV